MMRFCNKAMLYLCLVSVCFLSFTNICHALHPTTHRAINEHISKSSVSEFSLNDYLKDQLNIAKGYDEIFNGKEVYKWIAEGGEKEDLMGVRSMYHFHNPLSNKGLLGKEFSAIVWATLPVGGQSLAPQASWDDVRYYYRRALTAADKNERENWFALTFQGLGQMMHLVEDMSVPAHTRDDMHVFKADGYEKWFRNVKANPRAPAINEFPTYLYTADNKGFFLIPRLFDTGQYVGSNPGVTLSSSIGLAEYTNANFFSDDTINAINKFPHPKTDQCYRTVLPFEGPEGTYPREYFVKPCNESYCKTRSYQGYLLTAVDLNDYWRLKNPADPEPKPVIPILDDNVYYDYAQLLIPRAIGYASEVLKYFFRGNFAVKIGNGSLSIWNAYDETLGGEDENEFKLYYETEDHVRTFLAGAKADELIKGAKQTIAFNVPSQKVSSYILVFKGRLGAEPNAVIGQVIDPVWEHWKSMCNGKIWKTEVMDMAHSMPLKDCDLRKQWSIANSILSLSLKSITDGPWYYYMQNQDEVEFKEGLGKLKFKMKHEFINTAGMNAYLSLGVRQGNNTVWLVIAMDADWLEYYKTNYERENYRIGSPSDGGWNVTQANNDFYVYEVDLKNYGISANLPVNLVEIEAWLRTGTSIGYDVDYIDFL